MASLEWLRMIETDDVRDKAVKADALKCYCELNILAMGAIGGGGCAGG